MWAAERRSNLAQQRRLNRTMRGGSVPTPMPSGRPVRPETEPAPATPEVQPPVIWITTGSTPASAQCDRSASTNVSPIAMNRLEAESPNTVQETKRSNTAVALGAMALAVITFWMLVQYTMMSADSSAVLAFLAVSVPLRWPSTAPLYESIGERAGNAAAQLTPVITRHTGNTVVMVILLLLAKRAWGQLPAETTMTAKVTLGYVASEPRMDLLTQEEAQQLHHELLAGNEVPEWLPSSISQALCIVDTGCGRSMGNHGQCNA